jgi:hypothetical protein
LKTNKKSYLKPSRFKNILLYAFYTATRRRRKEENEEENKAVQCMIQEEWQYQIMEGAHNCPVVATLKY